MCKKADVDMNKRAGELTDDEVELLCTELLKLSHSHRVLKLKRV